VSISGELEHWLGRRLPVTLVWDFPTIELLAKALAEGNEQADTNPGPAEV
jgi:phthiocerol/phenolphthiocerol synthesis type-I polyketide synthase D